MKKIIIITVLAGWLISPAFAQHPPYDKNWKVVFQDDFSSPQLNSTLWYKGYGAKDAGKPEELLDFNISENVYIDSGKLVLRIKKENSPHCIPANGNPCKYIVENENYGIHPYTSGAIGSKDRYKYGYYEMYAKWSEGMGIFPAFWFFKCVDTVYNEIDIMESTGCKPNIFTTHDYSRSCITNTATNTSGNPEHYCNYSENFHWFGVEWDRDKITWYLDRKAIFQAKNNLWGGIGIHNPMQLILEIKLVNWEWEGCALDPTIDSAHFYIDTVNAYQLIYDCVNKNVSINDSTALANHDYKVKTSISLSGANTLTPGKNVSLRASNFIELKNEFYVPIGAELYLDINPCEGDVRVKAQ